MKICIRCERDENKVKFSRARYKCVDCVAEDKTHRKKTSDKNAKIYKKEYEKERKKKLRERKCKLLKEKKRIEENIDLINKKLGYPTNEKRNAYQNKRYKNDPVFRLSRVLRNRLSKYVTGKVKSFTKESRDILGCSLEQFKSHLEKMFLPGMNWSNYGQYDGDNKVWNIDHIKPIASFNLNDMEEVKKAFHYTNCQPLWAVDNLIKGAGAYDEETK